MTKASFLILPAACLMLSACVTTPEKVRVEGDGYKVEISDQDDGGSWKKGHCPPGHRMKGWC